MQKYYRRPHAEHAFSILEILVISLIMIVLGGAIVANYIKSYERAHAGKAVDYLNNMRNAQIICINETGGFNNNINVLKTFSPINSPDKYWNYTVPKVGATTFTLQATRATGKWKAGYITMIENGELAYYNAGGAKKSEWPPE
ncbi:MAG: type IV pilin protein [Candidatus Omnitrophica bacterium]|nr:type IV pilin protein [Candidatus Omnitrophota bacterium]